MTSNSTPEVPTLSEVCPLEELLGATYGPYLVVPRSAMQSMSAEWRQRFAGCLDQLLTKVDDLKTGVIGYEVLPIGRDGVVVEDPLKDFGAGLRRLFDGTQEF